MGKDVGLSRLHYASFHTLPFQVFFCIKLVSFPSLTIAWHLLSTKVLFFMRVRDENHYMTVQRNNNHVRGSAPFCLAAARRLHLLLSHLKVDFIFEKKNSKVHTKNLRLCFVFLLFEEKTEMKNRKPLQ